MPTVIMMLVASLLAVFLQGQDLSSITTILDSGFKINTGVADFDYLMSRGGLQSMLWTMSLGMLGMLYGAIMEKTGLLTAFLEKLRPLMKSTGGLITTVVLSSIILLAATASQTLAIVVGGRMYISEFKKKDLLPQTLSRTLEDSGTIVSPLIPWSLCGVYMTGTLGVSILYGFTNKFLWKTGEKASLRTCRDVVPSSLAELEI